MNEEKRRNEETKKKLETKKWTRNEFRVEDLTETSRTTMDPRGIKMTNMRKILFDIEIKGVGGPGSSLRFFCFAS